jgi:hypothetical protein
MAKPVEGTDPASSYGSLNASVSKAATYTTPVRLSVGDFDKARDVGVHYQVAGLAVLGCGARSCRIDAARDLLQAALDFFSCPTIVK